jgi:membrane protease YdiL (CAAX protease family)
MMSTEAPPVDGAPPAAWVGFAVTAGFVVVSMLWVVFIGIGLGVALVAINLANGQPLDPTSIPTALLGTSTLIQFAGLLAIAMGFAWLLGRPFADAFAVRTPPAAAVVGAILGGLVVGVLPGKLAEELMRWLPVLDMGNLAMINDAIAHGPIVGRVLLVLGVCVGAPLVEEFVFRGLLFDTIGRGSKPWVAWLVTSALFTAYHIDPIQMVGVAYTGLFLGWLRMTSRSVWPGVLAHAANNTLAAALALTFGDALKDAHMPWWQAGIAFFASLGFAGLATLRVRKPEAEPS